MNISEMLRFKVAFQTMKDYWKVTLIITLLFIGISVMYSGMYPAFKDTMTDMMETGFAEEFTAFRGSEDMASYVGFLNLELYQIFWILILGIFVGFISASIISKEVEGKTIDILMSNPLSRKQIVLEKFLGLIPMILVINFATMIAVMGLTIAIDEELDFGYLFLTHVASLPYLLAVLALGILISVILDDKMKASILMIATVVGMYIFESISLMIPDVEKIGYLSFTHYFNPYDILKNGEVDVAGSVILLVVAVQCIGVAMIYFEHRDIAVS